MKLKISFSELNNLIKKKFDLPVSFSELDKSSIILCYVPLNINIKLSILNINSNIITIGFEGLNLKDNLALKIALPTIQNKIPENIIDILPELNKGFINLNSIDNLEELFKQLEISEVHFVDNSFVIDGSLK